MITTGRSSIKPHNILKRPSRWSRRRGWVDPEPVIDPVERRRQEAREALRGRGIGFEDSDKIERLEELLARARRGMLGYTSCGVEELRGFCKARGVEGKGTRRHGKAEKTYLIRRLEQADDAPTFECFLELPPELRNRIYDMVLVHGPSDGTAQPIDPLKPTPGPDYISSDHDDETAASWRPANRTMALAKTNSQIRKECLPIFYGSNTFCFDFHRYRIRYDAKANEDPVVCMMKLKLWALDVVELGNLGYVSTIVMALKNGGCEGNTRYEPGCDMRLRICIKPGVVDVVHEEAQDGFGCANCKGKGVAVDEVKRVFKSAARDVEGSESGRVKINRKVLDGLLALGLKTEW